MIINNIKEPTTYFQDNVLDQKQYKGKTDRQAVLSYMQNEWKKTPILKKKPQIKEYQYPEYVDRNQEESLTTVKQVTFITYLINNLPRN